MAVAKRTTAQRPPAKNAAPKQQPLLVEEFASVQGMETREQRDAIQKGFYSWLLNIQPVGARTLRYLNGKGGTIYTLAGDTIIYQRTFILAATYYAIVFTQAGAAYQIRLSDGAVTTVGMAGTFYSGGAVPPVYNKTSPLLPHAVGLGNSGLIIVSQLGYWAWDGTTLFSAGDQAPGALSGLANPIVTTGNTHTNATLDNLGTTAGVVIGMGVLAADIPAGTTVLSVDSATAVTLSAPATGSNTAEAVSFTWLMPSGVTGNAIEIYNSIPWIVNGRQIRASAPGNGANFAVSAGGVNISVQDSYVQNGYSGIKQLDGFLYLFAHGAVDVISDVQTSGTPPTTTFLRINVSALIGTPWRDTIVSLPSSIAFSNPTGTFEVAGGQARKVSDPFDGVFENAVFPGNPSAFIATLSETACYGLTLSIAEPDTGVVFPALAMWQGKSWFLADQEIATTVVTYQDNDSVMSGWGSDGNNLFQMFQTPSDTLQKKAKSWFSLGQGGITWRKMIERLYAQFANAPANTPPFSEFNIDTELLSVSCPSIQSPPDTLQFVNNANQPLYFVNNVGGVLQFLTSAFPIIIAGGAPGIVCIMFGFTIESVCASLDLVLVAVGYKEYSRWE